MVESIGAKPLTGGERSVARIAATMPAVQTGVQTSAQIGAQIGAQPAARQVDAKPSATSSIALAQTMAAAAPINEARVAAVKKAVANGTFPILPATIADRLLAFKLEWAPHDKA
ncbi:MULTISPECIES: flagellar biosynthesis anti-sigma factor FlgM [unclassified Sphingomonas]|jgi:negative regulator of flagellin synthesis FlgM|uniref:flagellar biosynthesis anti-sigma factor FlgM n=1 Tax=unclassified Sphingomonas TaxID=196159 RepID=UPI002FE2A3EC